MSIRRFNLLKISQFSRRDVTCNIIIIGGENVGKTAMIVRFLTKKYLSEYSRGSIEIYERDVIVDNKIIRIRITDTLGTSSYTSISTSGLLMNQDAVIIVYSIIDRRSFLKACDMLKLLEEDATPFRKTPSPNKLLSSTKTNSSLASSHKWKPIIFMVGNKDDLSHLRVISTGEGQRISLCYSHTSFYECSTARGFENVENIFKDIIRKILSNREIRGPLSGAISAISSLAPTRRYSAGMWWRRHRTNSNSTSEPECEHEITELPQRHDRTFTM